MGEIHTNLTEDAAMAILGDFAFYAGKPDEKLVTYKPDSCRQDFIIMVPQNNGWANDFVSQYKDFDTYQALGLGVVVLKDGELVAGASSYSRYNEGIEIEIDTREDHRRKGLAYACGAKLILECLKKDLYPSWDAQNKWSASLAEKLGYHFSHEYKAYEITGF